MQRPPGIPCPYCGAPIEPAANLSNCPFCGEVLAAEVRHQLQPPAPRGSVPIWAVGVVLLLCCWPVGAVMVALAAPFRWRWRLLLILGSLLLILAYLKPYQWCTTTTSGADTSFHCGTPSSTPPR